MEILWRGTVDPDRTEIKPLHRTFNPAAQEDNTYFSATTIVGADSELNAASEPAMAVDQTSGDVYVSWVDNSADGKQKIYISDFSTDTESFSEPEIMVDLGTERNATRPHNGFDIR